MYTVIFSSRKNNNPDHNLFKLLDSFATHTNDFEKENSEFLIKFDLDDDVSDIIERLLTYPFTIKYFIWERNGGRSSLHEVQSYLYKFINPKSKWLQVMADDFVYTRNGFVTDILNIETPYCFIGTEDFMVNAGCRGTAPCFSRKMMDACAGFFGTQPNSDGFATGINDVCKREYGINLGLNIQPYYYRLSCESGEDWQSPFNKITKEDCTSNYQLMAKNVYLNILNDSLKLEDNINLQLKK